MFNKLMAVKTELGSLASVYTHILFHCVISFCVEYGGASILGGMMHVVSLKFQEGGKKIT